MDQQWENSWKLCCSQWEITRKLRFSQGFSQNFAHLGAEPQEGSDAPVPIPSVIPGGILSPPQVFHGCSQDVPCRIWGKQHRVAQRGHCHLPAVPSHGKHPGDLLCFIPAEIMEKSLKSRRGVDKPQDPRGMTCPTQWIPQLLPHPCDHLESTSLAQELLDLPLEPALPGLSPSLQTGPHIPRIFPAPTPRCWNCSGSHPGIFWALPHSTGHKMGPQVPGEPLSPGSSGTSPKIPSPLSQNSHFLLSSL